jgi:hypothetical protein
MCLFIYRGAGVIVHALWLVINRLQADEGYIKECLY